MFESVIYLTKRKRKAGTNTQKTRHRVPTIYIFLGRRKNTIEEGEEEDDLRRTISYHHRKIYRLKNREQRVKVIH